MFKIYKDNQDRDVYFDLVPNMGNGGVTLIVRDSDGNHLSNILRINADGFLVKYKAIDRSLGLKLDDNGSIEETI